MGIPLGDLNCSVSHELLHRSQCHPALHQVRSEAVTQFEHAAGNARSRAGAVPRLDIPPEERASIGAISGDALAPYAWNLASCTFGADCSANGAQLRDKCMRSGLGDFNQLQDAYSQLLAPLDFQQMIELRDSIIDAVKRGKLQH